MFLLKYKTRERCVNSDGSPYGGTRLQAIYHHYTGTATGTGPGVYKFGKSSSSTTWAKGDWISN